MRFTTVLVAALVAALGRDLLGPSPGIFGPVHRWVPGVTVLDGPTAVAAALPPPATTFVVQADLSVLAPPDLAPDVGARLARYAELESAAGARLYRLSETRLAAALDSGSATRTSSASSTRTPARRSPRT